MRQMSWFRPTVLCGLAYAVVGIVFALPVTHVRAWRLGAWVVSAAVFAVHIAYERFRLRNPPTPAALHVAIAVALGAFGLALRANIHSLSADPPIAGRPLLLVSLAIWPIMTAVPAFLVALATGAVLARAFARAGEK